MPRSCLRLVSVGLLTVGLVGCVPATDLDPVTVRLVNASDFTLDPNLYAASGTLSSSALFVPANLVTSFADGGLATVEPRASRTARVDCDAAGTLGVNRPVFTDSVGLRGGRAAATSFVLSEGVTFRCGQTLVLTYRGTEAGFGVTYVVE